MPALAYTSSGYPFTAFTKIVSADVVQCFTDIKTLLNTTGLDDTNIQNAGITRATKLKLGTANYVLINDGTGAMSQEQYLGMSRGGIGVNITPAGASDIDKVITVDGTGLALGLQVVPTPPSVKVYNFVTFT